MTRFDTSTNGLAEYTASNFGGACREISSPRASIDGSIASTSTRRGAMCSRQGALDRSRRVSARRHDAAGPGSVSGDDLGCGLAHGRHDRSRAARSPNSALGEPHPQRFARQEVSWVRAGDRFYLAGGDRRHEAYDPATDTWIEVAPLPERLDHIQGVESMGACTTWVGSAHIPSRPSEACGSTIPPRTASAGGGDAAAAGSRRGRGPRRQDLLRGRVVGRSGGGVVRRLRPGDGLVVGAAGHAAAAGPLPGAGGRRARFYAIGGRDSDVDANIGANDAYDFAAGAGWRGSRRCRHPVAATRRPSSGTRSWSSAASRRTGPSPRSRRTMSVPTRGVHSSRCPSPRHGIQAIACAGDVYIAAGGDGAVRRCAVERQLRLCRSPRRSLPAWRTASRELSGPAFVLRVPTGLGNPTSLQFGPDGRLYVSEQDGTIAVLTMHRTDAGEYEHSRTSV